jgi:hypothetical protein
MPINRAIHISALMEEVKFFNPSSILDVGVGFGMMGTLFRAFTDIRKSERNPDSFHDWPTKIDGIEIFEWYRNKAWDMYNNVFIGNALTEIDKCDMYDIIYAGDVIEHLSKENGYLLIDKMLAHANRCVIIATPSPAPPQEAILGNEHEAHISEWKEEDFAKYKCELIGNFYDFAGNMLVVRLMK